MTRTHKPKSTIIPGPEYSIHYPNERIISEQELEKHFEKLKKLLSTLRAAGK